jgi:hypothetical protein
LHAGTYIDKKCPFTGDISIRGRILSGIVKSTKMNKTIIVRRNYVHYIKKYARYVCKPGVSRQHASEGSTHVQAALLGSLPCWAVWVFECNKLLDADLAY